MFYGTLFFEINTPDTTTTGLPDGVMDDKDTDLEHISKDGLYRYRLINGNSQAVIIHHYLNRPTSIEFPTVMDGFLVVGIGKRAFAGLSCLRKITFPKCIKYFGEGAFNGCGVSELDFPESVRLVCNFAFSDCPNLKDVKGIHHLVHHNILDVHCGAMTAMARGQISRKRVLTLSSDLGATAFDNCPLLRLNRPDLIELESGTQRSIEKNEMERNRVNREATKAANLLEKAISENDCEQVKLLIQENPWLINSRCGENLQSPVFMAVIHNKIEILKCLASLGASFLVKDEGGNNLLHYAVRYANYQVFAYAAEQLKNKIYFDTPNYKNSLPCDILYTRFLYLYSDHAEDALAILKVLLAESSLKIDHEMIYSAIQYADNDLSLLMLENYEGDFTLKDLELAEKTLRPSAAWDEIVKRCPEKDKRDLDFMDYEEVEDDYSEIELYKKYHIRGSLISTAPGIEWHYQLYLVKKGEDQWSFRITDVDYNSLLGFYLVDEGQVDTTNLCRLVSENGMFHELFSWAKTHKEDKICTCLKDNYRSYIVDIEFEE